MIVIEIATEATAEIVAEVARMLPLLSRSSPAPTADEIAEIVASPATTLFVARESEAARIVGTLTLAMFRIPTGVRAWIRGCHRVGRSPRSGCGEMLTRAAIDAAGAAGAKTVELTSRPSREAANRLYRRIGFEIRETNVFRYSLEA